MILRGRGRSAVAGRGRTQGAAPADRRGQQVRVRASSASRPPEMAMPAVTIRLTGELRPARGDGRRGAGSGFRRQRPSTPTVVSGWERLAAVRLRSAATAAPAVADAPSAPAELQTPPKGVIAGPVNLVARSDGAPVGRVAGGNGHHHDVQRSDQ